MKRTDAKNPNYDPRREEYWRDVMIFLLASEGLIGMAATLARTRRAQQAGGAALRIESPLDVAKNTQVGIHITPMSMACLARRSRHSTHADTRNG
ncbi:hypothetical protein NMB33_08830 [Burkholderia sp. FXe9]|nr:hypothetical protein NMB33_08830 [Burkholderia sp. FXe9]